jgi:hypothetical protein
MGIYRKEWFGILSPSLKEWIKRGYK